MHLVVEVFLVEGLIRGVMEKDIGGRLGLI